MNPDRISPARSAGAPPGDVEAHEYAQRLSALLDGELDAEESKSLVERVGRDEEACRLWERLSCVGDAIRSAEVASFHSHGFVARVAEALRREPTVLAPIALPGRPTMRRWLLPGAGAAVAAAVLIAVGLPARQDASPAATVARSTSEPATRVVVASPAAVVERSPQLERYLAAHRELAEPSLMPHSTPYVRTSGTVLMPPEGR